MILQERIPLSQYSTFHIGGPARYFIEVRSVDELREAYAYARTHHLPVHLLGGGSNTLVRDAGFDGLVLRIANKDINFSIQEGVHLLTASSGEEWDQVVVQAVEHGLYGLENLSGIPGTVGGAVVQNIGAYGAALSEVLHSVRVYNNLTESVETLSNTECHFGYRESIFQQPNSPYVVTEAIFALGAEHKPNLSYKDLASYFTGRTPSLSEIRTAVLSIRRDKFPNIVLEGTAGSFFKNPILSNKEVNALRTSFPALPVFSLPETEGKKIPLAWFLDERNSALMLEVRKIGGARLFEKQPLVIAAARGTSAQDVLTLATAVKDQIKKELHIEINFEVKII